MIVNAHSMTVVPDSTTLGIPLLGLPSDLMSGIGLVHLNAKHGHVTIGKSKYVKCIYLCPEMQRK